MLLALIISSVQAANVSVKVVDASTGAPISNVFVQCNENIEETVVTDKYGRALLFCPMGEHTVSVFHDVYGKKQIPLHIDTDDSSCVTLGIIDLMIIEDETNRCHHQTCRHR